MTGRRVTDMWGREVDIDRMCVRKHSYPTRSAAKSAARKWGRKVYRCPICRLWHLTSRRATHRRT